MVKILESAKFVDFVEIDDKIFHILHLCLQE